MVIFSGSFVFKADLKAVGVRTRKVFKMGDEVTVKLVDADLHTRHFQFEIAEGIINR